MGFHLGAFSESQLDDGTFQAQAAVEDDIVFTSGDDLRVPRSLDRLLGAVGFIGDQAAATRGRIVAPSLRGFLNVEIIPLYPTEPPASQNHVMDIWPRSPIALAVGESINYESDGGGNGAAAQDCSALVWLGDGPVQPVDGDMRTVRATTVVVTVQRQWSSATLVFAEDLPAGRYAVVGARFQDGNLGAGRLIFVEGGGRPGTVGCTTLLAADLKGSRRGGWGVWGEFDINQPPSAEFLSLGGTDTNPDVYLDIMRIG